MVKAESHAPGCGCPQIAIRKVGNYVILTKPSLLSVELLQNILMFNVYLCSEPHQGGISWVHLGRIPPRASWILHKSYSFLIESLLPKSFPQRHEVAQQLLDALHISSSSCQTLISSVVHRFPITGSVKGITHNPKNSDLPVKKSWKVQELQCNNMEITVFSL